MLISCRRSDTITRRSKRRVRLHRMIYRCGVISIGLLIISSCKDISGTPPLPPGVRSPDTYNTPLGALGQVRALIALFRSSVYEAITLEAMFTDEQTVVPGNDRNPADHRYLDPSLENSGYQSYQKLHDVRAQSRLARGAVYTYAPDAPRSVIALSFALEGYAVIKLADIFCSGVPLSTVNFPDGFTLQPGSSTEDLYRYAAKLLDSAVRLSTDDVDSIQTLARVGLARALAAIGLMDSAAKVVANVPVDSKFTLRLRIYPSQAWPLTIGSTVADREGKNGLAFITSGDPRSRTSSLSQVSSSGVPYIAQIPTKYREIVADSTSLVLASGVEARLIAAEAALASGDTKWLMILNELRTNGQFTVSLRTEIPGVSPRPVGHPDTTWEPGGGIGLIPAVVLADQGPVCEPNVACTDTVWYRGLGLLKDPGEGLPAIESQKRRVDLLFRERAFWLFMTGHRMGDLRKMIRVYNRNHGEVYPSGVYMGFGNYGDAVVMPIPSNEYANPQYRGCLHLGA